MRTRTLSFQVGAYDDGSFYLALVETAYENGRALSPDVLASRLVSEEQVLSHMWSACDHLVRQAMKDQRQRCVAAGERE